MTLGVGGLSLRLTGAPGHAPDQLVVYDEANAMLWAADILSNLGIPCESHNLDACEQALAAWVGTEAGARGPRPRVGACA